MSRGATEPPRVLHVMWSLAIGGAERALYQLVRGQREAGLDAGVLVASDLGLYGDRLVAEGVPVQTLGQRRGLDLAACLRARPAFAGCDVVHFHVAEPPLMLMAARGRARTYYTHRAGAFRYAASRKMRYRAAGTALRRFTGIVGNTGHAADVASERFSVPRERIAIVYNGIDWEILKPERSADEVRAELGLGAENCILGTSANLRDIKRVDMVIRSLQGTPANVVFVVLGDGPDGQRLEMLARSLGLDDRVRFAGKQSNVADFLQVCDMFVLPSGTEESFGNSAVEAMGFGVPTIVMADGGGLLEHVEHEKSGIVARDERDLAGWISSLASDDALRRSLGTRGRAAVRAKYSIERMVTGYSDLYVGRPVPSKAPAN